MKWNTVCQILEFYRDFETHYYSILFIVSVQPVLQGTSCSLLDFFFAELFQLLIMLMEIPWLVTKYLRNRALNKLFVYLEAASGDS